jgi:hypothetical protein
MAAPVLSITGLHEGIDLFNDTSLVVSWVSWSNTTENGGVWIMISSFKFRNQPSSHRLRAYGTRRICKTRRTYCTRGR